jgi:hypothetical protein
MPKFDMKIGPFHHGILLLEIAALSKIPSLIVDLRSRARPQGHANILCCMQFVACRFGVNGNFILFFWVNNNLILFFLGEREFWKKINSMWFLFLQKLLCPCKLRTLGGQVASQVLQIGLRPCYRT